MIDTPKTSTCSLDRVYLSGKLRIAGTRTSVSMILNLPRGGQAFEEIVRDDPSLTIIDIKAALAYAESLVPGVPAAYYDEWEKAARERAAKWSGADVEQGP